MLHKHMIIASGTKLASAVIPLRINDDKEAFRMDETDGDGQWRGELMNIHAKKKVVKHKWNETRKSKLSMEKQKAETGRTRFD